MKSRTLFRSALALAALGACAVTLTPTAMAQGATAVDTTPSKHLEIIHHPNYDKTVFMPFVPAIKIKSGKILWLARRNGAAGLPRPSSQA